MYGLIVFLHVLICVFLAVIILMQSGKGGGLTENFAAAESLFGATTNTVLVKATAVLAAIFIVTSLSLAFLSSKSNKSLISAKAARAAKAASSALPAQSALPQDAKEAVANMAPEAKPTETNANPEASQQPKELEPAGSSQTSESSQ